MADRFSLGLIPAAGNTCTFRAASMHQDSSDNDPGTEDNLLLFDWSRPEDRLHQYG